MNTEVVQIDEYTLSTPTQQPAKSNPFLNTECVLKSCCKKYKKGKRCKKCPD
ncbi:hypothetical protein [Spirosoma rhododendri]|uniref:Uncharacterized protein n=1 Tax=Spirosoma rhododendri TaxID=2728024 RepID=A0A7L5DYJ9_9BACT|nr:hypothetical protein [Spirosoma rhododendri]QJD81057.1 hypothetical protein HH216_23500 [Spirosoma rhododendri]